MTKELQIDRIYKIDSKHTGRTFKGVFLGHHELGPRFDTEEVGKCLFPDGEFKYKELKNDEEEEEE